MTHASQQFDRKEDRKTMQTRREFLLTGLALGASALPLPDAAAAKAVKANSAAKLRAGAGRADVLFAAELYPLDGFAGQHDPLAVRVLLLDSAGMRIAIAVIDLTSISGEMISGMKAILTKVTGVPAERAIVCASHTFSTPHVFPSDHTPPGTDLQRNNAILACFEAALLSAATQAARTLQPARLGYGVGTSRVAVNRDVATSGGWWLGSNDSGYTDPAVGVLRIDALDGKPLAILMNAAVQPSVMDGSQRAQGGKLISADLAGAAARHVEQYFGAGAVAMVMVGAAGDQAPYLQAYRHVVNADGSVGRVDIHEAGFALVDLLGEKLGGEVVRVAEGIKTVAGHALDIRRDSVEVEARKFSPQNAASGPVTSFDYQAGGKAAIPVVLLQLGEVVLVGVQPELSAIVGAQIRAGSPYAHTIVATMVDGAAKYLPDQQAFDRYTYEARSSPYAPGAAEAATGAIVARLKQMYNLKK
jgi:neutral ceramidase